MSMIIKRLRKRPILFPRSSQTPSPDDSNSPLKSPDYFKQAIKSVHKTSVSTLVQPSYRKNRSPKIVHSVEIPFKKPKIFFEEPSVQNQNALSTPSSSHSNSPNFCGSLNQSLNSYYKKDCESEFKRAEYPISFSPAFWMKKVDTLEEDKRYKMFQTPIRSDTPKIIQKNEKRKIRKIRKIKFAKKKSSYKKLILPSIVNKTSPNKMILATLGVKRCQGPKYMSQNAQIRAIQLARRLQIKKALAV